MARRVCAACGRVLDQLVAVVYIGDKRLYYCHDDDSDCYGPATWAGYPEASP